MAVLRLKHVEQWADRYGKTRYYFRKGKGKRIPLQGLPGTDAFNQSYQNAAKQIGASPRSQDGTFNALAIAYFKSVKFLAQKESSKAVTRGILDRFLDEHGHRLVRQMTMQDVDMLIAAKAKTPAAANNLLKKLKVLTKFAIKIGMIDRDPTVAAEKFKEGTHHTWTESEIAKFEKHWPLGSRERIAFDLHIYTGQRRGDVRAMNALTLLDGNRVTVIQEKTGRELIIPMHPNLIASLTAWHGSGETIIAQANGKRYTVESYGNLMADAIAQARLPARCVLHGLKKAAGRRLAEAGCSVHQIASILGNVSLEEIERYTKAANQELLAGQAIDSLGKFKKA